MISFQIWVGLIDRAEFGVGPPDTKRLKMRDGVEKRSGRERVECCVIKSNAEAIRRIEDID